MPMTATDAEAMSALNELLAERQRYEAWLSALEQRRESTPAHVYSRVQIDYESRLNGVTQSLSERAGQLTATIDDLSLRLAKLREEEADRSDARHEIELRAAVGELTPEEWDRRRAEADRQLGGIGAERQDVESQLAELQRVVALTREPARRTATGSDAQPIQQARGGEVARDSDDSGDSARAATGEWDQASAAPMDTSTDALTDPASSSMDSPLDPSIDEFVAAAAQGDGVPEVPEVDDAVQLGDGVPDVSVNRTGAAGADYSNANGVVTNAASRESAHAPSLETGRDNDKTL